MTPVRPRRGLLRDARHLEELPPPALGRHRAVHARPHEAALDHWDRRLAAATEQWTGTVLDGDVPGVDPELAAAARRYLEGRRIRWAPRS
ncbi:hypothetical protein NKH77_50755 [Streptomyces sp. M19]